MKPPWRLRALPARFLQRSPSPGRPQRGSWGPREKKTLLAELRAQARRGLPEQLLPAALREKLPHRSEEEIRALLVRLRGRAARESLGCKFRNFLRGQRRVRAPIQVWQDLTETLMGGALEGPPSAAFSQVLTVAATEPLSLEPPGAPPNPGAPPGRGAPPGPGAAAGAFREDLPIPGRGQCGGRGPPWAPQRPPWFCPYWERFRPNWEHWAGLWARSDVTSGFSGGPSGPPTPPEAPPPPSAPP